MATVRAIVPAAPPIRTPRIPPSMCCFSQVSPVYTMACPGTHLQKAYNCHQISHTNTSNLYSKTTKLCLFPLAAPVATVELFGTSGTHFLNNELWFYFEISLDNGQI